MSEAIRDWLHRYVNDPAFSGKYRYYAAVLARLDAVEDPHVPVMAVSAHGSRFYRYVNVDFFIRPPTNLKYLRGVLLHEVHHVVLGHLANPKYQQAEHPDLMQLAMEISAGNSERVPLSSAVVRAGWRATPSRSCRGRRWPKTCRRARSPGRRLAPGGRARPPPV
jgi:hypothetical protein